jgi:hypothetical protein
VNVGNYPSVTSLTGQLNDMKQKRLVTQKRVRDAVARLKAKTLLVTMAGDDKSPSGNPWLKAVGIVPPVVEEQK